MPAATSQHQTYSTQPNWRIKYLLYHIRWYLTGVVGFQALGDIICVSIACDAQNPTHFAPLQFHLFWGIVHTSLLLLTFISSKMPWGLGLCLVRWILDMWMLRYWCILRGNHLGAHFLKRPKWHLFSLCIRILSSIMITGVNLSDIMCEGAIFVIWRGCNIIAQNLGFVTVAIFVPP